MANDASGGLSIKVRYPTSGVEALQAAARELARGLGGILGCPGDAAADPRLEGAAIVADLGESTDAMPAARDDLAGDTFEISRPSPHAIAIRSGSERGVLHGACDLMERLGARFIPGAPARFPRLEAGAIARVEPYRVVPAFSRRAVVSDLMTWNYNFPDRLALHLEFDREFIPWMARRGINAFDYIRHSRDTIVRIDELAALYRAYGIGCEYGGHVLQLLMPRGRFETNPDYFPLGAEGGRNARGNLCVSNRDAVQIVCDGALDYVREYPENQFLHVWGADVWDGAWCSCSRCKALSPQLQYMAVVNAVATALESAGTELPVAYLAYHDTIEPDPKLQPLPNVHFEWAPRERCYSHAIDDSSCSINAKYLPSLRRYIDLFEGRGQVFEYYADAILFGGATVAFPAIIARDLRAYKRLGIDSISCLTFGAYSTLAYPVNLEAFVRGTRTIDIDSGSLIEETAAARHPEAAHEMAQAYRKLEEVSAAVLGYGDVLRPYKMTPKKAAAKKAQFAEALEEIMEPALAIVEGARDSAGTLLLQAEAELWNYSIEVLSAIGDYLRALEEHAVVRRTLGESALANVAGAVEHIRRIDSAIKGTWGAYDIEWIREIWLDGLTKNLAGKSKSGDDIF